MTDFQSFRKIARLSRDMIVTEKIDGSNAQVYIVELDGYEVDGAVHQSDGLAMYAGSRKRWITPDHDNFGFAAWAYEHKGELLTLGPGRHFGEWWGCGIQRRYGLTEKRFSLFDVQRWCLHGTEPQRIVTGDPLQEKYQDVLPECCGLVPILYRGTFSTPIASFVLSNLERNGSQAAPGFPSPEGIVVYHVAGNVAFKKTIGNDGAKGTAT